VLIQPRFIIVVLLECALLLQHHLRRTDAAVVVDTRAEGLAPWLPPPCRLSAQEGARIPTDSMPAPVRMIRVARRIVGVMQHLVGLKIDRPRACAARKRLVGFFRERQTVAFGLVPRAPERHDLRITHRLSGDCET